MIVHLRSASRRAIGLAGLALPLALGACVTSPPAVAGARTAGELGEAYRQAIVDAAVFEPSEAHDLPRITDDTATVVTWTSHTSSYPAGATVTTSWGVTWVTVLREMQAACRTFAPASLRLRLEQFLGLPPDDQVRSFVVLRVARTDLFRPCPNPDVTVARCTDPLVENAPDWLYRFLARQFLDSYRYPDGYPWTHLGYTYDWGSRAPPHYGAAEFVIQPNATVRVVSIQSSEDLCSAPAGPGVR